MPDRITTVQKAMETGVVAVIRTNSSDELVGVARALREGGIVSIEVTMTTPGALDAISAIAKQFKGEVIVGAGSVLDPESARACILAGAEFIVAPVLNKEVIALCHRYDKAIIPGAYTPTEILSAWEAGADVVKVFPATSLGPQFFKDIRGPLPQVKLTPTGGVTLESAGEFIKAGAVFVGVGGNLVDKKAVAERRWDVLTATAARYIDVVRAARSQA